MIIKSSRISLRRDLYIYPYYPSTLWGGVWLYLKHYINNTNHRLVDELHTFALRWHLAADCPLNYKSWFYHTTSNYLCHKLCRHTYLVKIALGASPTILWFITTGSLWFWPKKKFFYTIKYTFSSCIDRDLI